MKKIIYGILFLILFSVYGYATSFYSTKISTSSITGNFVSKSGDIMTGDLTVPNLIATSTITANYGIKTLAVVSYGNVSVFPTGLGNYAGMYYSSIYGCARFLGYNGTAYANSAFGTFYNSNFSVYASTFGLTYLNDKIGVGYSTTTALNDSLEVNGRIKDKTGYLAPIGAMSMFAGSVAPTGWLICDGSAISRTTYADLFAVIGTTYGVGDNSTTFNIPDYRGAYPIGSGTSTKFTENETFTLGQVVNDRIQGHKHAVNAVIYGTTLASGTAFAAGAADLLAVSVQNPTTDGVNGTPRTGKTTLVKSIVCNYIIKY